MSDNGVLPARPARVPSWPPPDDENAQALHGKDGNTDGVSLTVEWRAGEDVHGTTDAYVHLAGAGGSYRAAPLVRVLRPAAANVAQADCIVVGRARVRVGASKSQSFPTTLTVSLDSVWTRSLAGGHWRYRDPGEWAQDKERRRLLEALAEPRHQVPQGDADAISTVIAKGIAEESRNSMSALRDVRYQLEAQLTSGLPLPEPTAKHSEVAPEVVLVNLIEIRRAMSRVRDFAREAVRTALAAHGTNEDVYHAHRAYRDRTRIIGVEERMETGKMLKLPWVRQCERLDEGLKDEVEVIGGLLSALATIASAQEAQAQGEFNAVAAAVAVAFGLPAVLGGAGASLPRLPRGGQGLGEGQGEDPVDDRLPASGRRLPGLPDGHRPRAHDGGGKAQAGEPRALGLRRQGRQLCQSPLPAEGERPPLAAPPRPAHGEGRDHGDPRRRRHREDRQGTPERADANSVAPAPTTCRKGGTVDEEVFNMSVRKFLKTLGVTAQREIELAVREQLEAGDLQGGETLDARATVTVAGLSREVVVTGQISLA
jgi:Family of unknown function (DUF6494)